MSDLADGGGSGGGGSGWLWAAATSAQLVAGIASYRRGCAETTMPFKAFAIATLFVGAGATAVVGSLHAAGIRSVDDMKEVGASIRVWARAPPRRTG